MNTEQTNPEFHKSSVTKMFFKQWLMPPDQNDFFIEFGEQYKGFKLTENIPLINDAPAGWQTTVRKLALEQQAVSAISDFKNNFDKNIHADFSNIGLIPTYKEINLVIPENTDAYKKYKILRKSISDLITNLIKESKYPEAFRAIHGNDYLSHWESIIFTDPYIQRLLDIGPYPILRCSSLDVRVCKKIFVSFNAETQSPSMLQFGHIPFKDPFGKPFEYSVIQTLPVLGVINVERI